MRQRFFIFATVLAWLLAFTCLAFTQEQPEGELKNAIWLYEHENYEEALVVLKRLRQEQPSSSFIAYYLGVTYKQLQDFQSARPHLEAAVTLSPRIKNAVLELIDVLYQCDDIPEAKKWLGVAEEESIVPAQTAFLKGLVLLKEGQDINGALAAFDRAATLDKGLENAVQYQKALVQLQAQKLSAARDIFQKIITQEPSSDMAAFANEYLAAITRKEEARRPFHATFGAGLAYDTNVVSRPRDRSLNVNVVPREDWRSVYTLQGDYQRKLADWFGVRAGYSLYYAKQFDLGFYDTLSQDVSVQPGIYLKKAAITFPVHYNYMTLNDKKYLQVFGIGNLNSIAVGRHQMVQCLLQYTLNNYAWPQTNYDENRDSNDYLWSVGWYYFFGKNRQGFLNLRYAIDYNAAHGCNWGYVGNRFTMVTTIPLGKRIRLTVAGDYLKEGYRKVNSAYNESRTDNIFTFSNLIAIEIFKNTDLETQYTFVKNQSSISAYEYVRKVVSMGLKYKF